MICKRFPEGWGWEKTACINGHEKNGDKVRMAEVQRMIREVR